MDTYPQMVESAIQGLMILGRTRQEAIDEIRKNENLRYEMMLHEDMEALDRNMANRGCNSL